MINQGSAVYAPTAERDERLFPVKIASANEAKILIVDDEQSNVRLLERILANANFTDILSTLDPYEAVALFEKHRPDLVLTDLLMPGIDGFEVMRRMRLLIPDGEYLPIVVLTADVTPKTKRRALAAGATDFLTKPLDNTEIVLRINNLLDTRNLHLRLQKYNSQLEKTVEERTRELRAALVELKATQRQAIQKERLSALGTMAGGIAHDFNNSLTVILGFSELLLRDAIESKNDHSSHVLQTILTAAEDGAKIVDRLRAFQRPMENHDVRLPVSLNEMVTQAICLTKPKWETQTMARGINVHTVTDLGEVPTVAANATELREVLTNMIFNAVDAMPDGGTITLRTRFEDGWVSLQISDTGTGMSEETRQRCLEPFFTTKGERGTGLGLAMVYGIIQRHEGRINLHTELGKGTTFDIRLPLGTVQLDAVNAVESPRMVDRPLRILVVDDQPVLCHLLCEYLSQDFHLVETATSGAEALEKFDGQQFDIVITDKAMPGMSGDQLAEAIKERNPVQPVIQLTGFTDADSDEGKNPAVDLMLAKPLSHSALRHALVQVITK